MLNVHRNIVRIPDGLLHFISQFVHGLLNILKGFGYLFERLCRAFNVLIKRKPEPQMLRQLWQH